MAFCRLVPMLNWMRVTDEPCVTTEAIDWMSVMPETASSTWRVTWVFSCCGAAPTG